MTDSSDLSLDYVITQAGRLWRAAQVHSRIWKAVERRASGDGVTVPQVRLFLAIADSPGATNGDLAVQLGMQASQVSFEIGKLRKAGLVANEVSSANRRERPRSLTENGQIVADRVRNKVAEAYHAEFERLGAADQALMAVTLEARSPVAGGRAGSVRHYDVRTLQPGGYGWVLSQLTRIGRQRFQWGTSYLVDCAAMIASQVSQAPANYETAWIVATGANPVGGCLMTYGSDPILLDSENFGVVAWVSALFVTGEFQGRGLGVRLLDRCIEEAGKIGVRSLHIRVSDRQTHLTKVVKRAGFKVREWKSRDHRYGPVDVWREYVLDPNRRKRKADVAPLRVESRRPATP